MIMSRWFYYVLIAGAKAKFISQMCWIHYFTSILSIRFLVSAVVNQYGRDEETEAMSFRKILQCIKLITNAMDSSGLSVSANA